MSNRFHLLPMTVLLMAAAPAFAQITNPPPPYQPPTGPGGVGIQAPAVLFTSPLHVYSDPSYLRGISTFRCEVLNRTSHSIAMHVEVRDDQGNPMLVYSGGQDISVPPGQVGEGPLTAPQTQGEHSAYCMITFKGSKDDVRGVLTATGLRPGTADNIVMTSEAR